MKREAAAPKCLWAGALAVYLLAVLWYTLGRRSVGYYPRQTGLFWSYRLWFGGEGNQGWAILANIAMFVPLGFLIAGMGSGRRNVFLWVFPLALAFSALIETAQLALLRGCFEFDDICDNAAGAVLGAALLLLLRRLLPKRLLRAALPAACAGIVLFCAGLFFCFPEDGGEGAMKPLSQGLCFQAEEASFEDGEVKLTGLCFWYESGPADYTVVLRATETGKRYALQTSRGIPRPDAGTYFGRENLRAGFTAAGGNVDAGEYELTLDFGLLRVIPTGVYLTVEEASGASGKAELRRVQSAALPRWKAEGTALEAIVSEGVLCAAEPAHHVYVYWREGTLYWVAEDGFSFEADGSTRLELALWTAEPDKLPENAKAKGRQYDLIGVSFEKNELTGDFGPCRVCAREVPTAYPITSIKTGYYAGDWVWQASFWPVYRFSD